MSQKINTGIKFLLSLFLLINAVAYAADTASILPPAKTTFFDQNGKPLSSGKVYFYIPSTITLKTTWQDAAETIANANPVSLDAAGRAIIYGSGSYRQLVKDKNNNTVWDQVTSSGGSGGGSGTTVGDGIAVGMALYWPGMVAPSNYAFAYGQELSRTTYSTLFLAYSQTQVVTCTSGSPILTSIADTSQINFSTSKVESPCISGSAQVLSKTASTITLSVNAIVSTTTNATVFLYGNGNGVTTFNVPDYRGYDLTGRCNMGGSNCANITTTYFNDPNSTGGKGGVQSIALNGNNLPAYTPTGTIAVTNGSITNGAITSTVTGGTQGGTSSSNLSGGGTSTPTGPSAIIVTSTQAPTSQAASSATFTGSAQGGIAEAFSNIPPSKTVNIIIKISPDVNLSIARCADLIDSGTACTANTGTSGHTLPYLDTSNTWSLSQIFANVAISGGSITGMANPVVASDVANKAYVDSLASGLNILASSTLATAAVLPNTPTYANGAAGVGATLTAGSNTTLTVDGVVAPLTTVVLVKNQASAFQNGVYTVTTAGSGAAAWVLTRATYFDQAAEMKAGSYTFITGGATNIGSAWTLQTAVATVGTDPSNWALFSSTNNSSINPTILANAFGGRLTLISGKSVMSADCNGCAYVYYAPYSGKAIPVRVGGVWGLYTFTTSSTDQIGLTLNLAASANWPANTIYDVFGTVDSGTLKLATRAWDSAMLPSAPSQITNVTTITTGTTPTAWTRATGAFDGTVVKNGTTSATIAPANANLANCLGQNFGAPQTISQVIVTAPTDHFIMGNIGPMDIRNFGSNDGVNFYLTAINWINDSAIGNSYTLPINILNQVPYQYYRTCFDSFSSGANVWIAQIQYYNTAGPSTRRLILQDGILVNDAVIPTARITAAATISVAQYEGSFLGVIQTDSGTAGVVSANFTTFGGSKVVNLWNAYNPKQAVMQVGVATDTVNSYIPNTSKVYGMCEGDGTYFAKVLSGMDWKPITASLSKAVFINTGVAANAYEVGIAVDNTSSFSGTGGSTNVDNTGTAIGGPFGTSKLTLPPFYGTKTLNCIERNPNGLTGISVFNGIRSGYFDVNVDY